jgi:hypothetical protein
MLVDTGRGRTPRRHCLHPGSRAGLAQRDQRGLGRQ